MATRWADGFDDMASGVANFAPDYNATAGTGLNVTTGRRTGTQALSTTNGSLVRAIGGTESTMFQSIAINGPTLVNGPILRFNEGSVTHIQINITTTGALAVYRSTGTTLLGTSTPFITAGSWGWAQVKVVIHDTAGSVEIRDGSGVVLLNLTGIDTRNGGTGYCDSAYLGGPGGAAYALDDWHVWDATGAVCNTFTNDSRIDHRLPTGAGNYAQFTPSAGANYTCVDEATWNATDYVESATAGQKDSYQFADLTHSPPTIFSVVRTVLGQKDDAGARSIKPLTRIGTTDYTGAAATLNQGSYTRAFDVLETNPATGAAWTQAGFNAAEHGFENV